jgi:predicted Zn-dependent protease
MRALSRVQGLDDPASAVPVNEAVIRLRLALLAAPGDPDVLRVAARFTSRMRLREAVDHWARYLSSNQSTDAERIEAAGVDIEGGRPDLGRQWLGEVLGRMPDDPRILGPLFQLALRIGTGAGAEKVARRRVELAPGDVDAQLDLGRLLLQSPDPTAREEALKVLTAVGCDDKVPRIRRVTCALQARRRSS